MSDRVLETELDNDGAAEVVARQPRRKAVAPIDVAQVTGAPAGGRMKAMSIAGAAARREFIVLRKAGSPATRVALPHIVIFKGLWRLWETKRIAGGDDPGVSITEISDLFESEDSPLPVSSISAALRALARNGAARSIDEYIGWSSRRTRYYPTSTGVEAFALAEVLGDGSFVQVGRTAKSWRDRNQGEPANLFQHAALIRGWADPADLVESV